MRRLSIYPTASKIGLALHCAYPWTSGLAWPEQETGAPALLGTAGHLIGERAIKDQPCDPWTIAEEVGLSEADTRTLVGISGQICHAVMQMDGETQAEVAVAYHVASDSARILSTSGARDYSGAMSGELVGTADVVWRRESGQLVILDWKTGRGARQVRVAETAQMRFLGLAFARAYVVDSVTIQLAHVDEHETWIDSTTLDAWELDAIAAEMRALAAALEAEPTPKPGAHCASSYCPLVAACPATQTALATLAGQDVAPAFPLSTAIESAEHARYIYDRIGAAEAALEAVRKALKAYTERTGPLDLGGGKAWGPVIQDGRESIDLSADGAESLLRERLGDAFPKAVEVSTSKEAIKRAAGSAKAQRAILDELRTLGAVKTGAPWAKWTEFARVADAE